MNGLLELEPESHVYRLDGVQIPGCTAVLAAMGCTPGFFWLTPDELAYYRSRGHGVHKAIELAVKGTLDKRTISGEVNPYLVGWDLFCEERDVEVLELDGEPFVEKSLHHPVFRYGVTPDVVARVGNETGVIELKATSVHGDAEGLQTAAQLLAVRSVMPKIGSMRIGLRLLPEDPYYDPKPYTERSDESTFVSLLNSYNWLARHKLLRENHR